jgi:hypothetical protein
LESGSSRTSAGRERLSHRQADHDVESSTVACLHSLSGRMPYEPTEPPTPDTTPGFDHVTGLGSPTGDYPWSNDQ